MAEQPLWKRYRHEFPVTERLTYLNHAAVAPLCKRAADAMRGLAEDALFHGSFHYQEWMECYEGLRVSAAKLINADAREIAIVKNTSEGVATIALGIDWKPGDVVVAFKEEFPANYFPWLQLEPKGVVIRWLSIYDDLVTIDAAANGARLLAISYVNYLSGYRVDLEGIGKICERHGCFYFVDAIQGLGVFPLDVRKAKIHALAADAHKWLLGPEGCGVMYVQREKQDEVYPVEFGWTNVAKYNDYSSRDMTLRDDAGRYEPGTLNTIGCYGVRGGVELLLEVGLEEVGPAVRALTDQVWDGVRGMGCETLGIRTPESASGIVSFRKPGVDAFYMVKKLKDLGFTMAQRQGWVRVAPHFYISPQDIERLLAAIRDVN